MLILCFSGQILLQPLMYIQQVPGKQIRSKLAQVCQKLDEPKNGVQLSRRLEYCVSFRVLDAPPMRQAKWRTFRVLSVENFKNIVNSNQR